MAISTDTRIAPKTRQSAASMTRRSILLSAVASPFVLRQARAAEQLRAYAIWPENYARPMLEEVNWAHRFDLKTMVTTDYWPENVDAP